VKQAYEARAGHVTVIWTDDEVTRLEYENVGLPYFENTPAWKVEQLNGLAEKGACFLFLEGSDPSILQGIDPSKPAAASRARNRDCQRFRDGMDFGINAWCIAGVPVEPWAAKVFPDLPRREALYRLWMAILQVARADGSDPQAAWETHNATFDKNKRLLNRGAFDALRYHSSNGTDLVVGMNPGHIWEGGSSRTQSGTIFFPNIPTEEVFTSPKAGCADGVVYASKPLSYRGELIENFSVRFEGGRAVEVHAEKGEELLKEMIAMDEGAAYLGECALVPVNSPISESGLIFWETLFDENAACHLALGMGFTNTIRGFESKTIDECRAMGINDSMEHNDFMIGYEGLDIDAVTRDGKVIPIFRRGRWAF
jgi:aminopeptidase